jgi:hypothetical protein
LSFSILKKNESLIFEKQKGSERIILRNPKIIDGFGERIALSKCKKCNSNDYFVSICEMVEVEFLDSRGRVRNIHFAGRDGYEIQFLIDSLMDGSISGMCNECRSYSS